MPLIYNTTTAARHHLDRCRSQAPLLPASTVSLPSALSTPISWPRPLQWARRVAVLSTTSGDQRRLGTAPPRQPDVEEQGLHHATTGDGALLRRVASPEYSRR